MPVFWSSQPDLRVRRGGLFGTFFFSTGVSVGKNRRLPFIFSFHYFVRSVTKVALKEPESFSNFLGGFIAITQCTFYQFLSSAFSCRCQRAALLFSINSECFILLYWFICLSSCLLKCFHLLLINSHDYKHSPDRI